jgi:N-formylmaleamate deformylase
MKTLILALLISVSLAAQVSFRVQVTGKGQPVILIPGLSSGGETWDSTVARYKDRFECHVITVAGFAGVPRVAPPREGMMSQVRDELVAYVKTKSLVKPVLIGHSLGGFIVLDLASRYPDLPGRIVIVDAYPFQMGLDPTMTPARARVIAGQIQKGIAGMSQEAYEAYATAGSSTNNLVTSEVNQKRLIEWARTSDRMSVANALAEMLGVDLRSDVGNIKAPAMVLAAWRGSEDVGASYQMVDKNMHDQYSKLTGVEIHVSNAARHFIMWDDPQWMFGYLDRFLVAK